MSDNTREMLAENLEHVSAFCDQIEAVLDGETVECKTCSGTGYVGPEDNEEDCEDCDATGEIAAVLEDHEEQDIYEFLNEWPLEVVWEMGEPFAVVLGTGGPHVEITGGGRSGGYTLHGYWGGEHVTKSGSGIRRVGGYFRDMVDQD